MNTAEMWIKAGEDGKTYRFENLYYNNKLGFVDEDGKEYNFIGWDSVESILAANKWVESKKMMTKEEVESKYNIKII
mgnify:CR=1 FL=1